MQPTQNPNPPQFNLFAPTCVVHLPAIDWGDPVVVRASLSSPTLPARLEERERQIRHVHEGVISHAQGLPKSARSRALRELATALQATRWTNVPHWTDAAIDGFIQILTEHGTSGATQREIVKHLVNTFDELRDFQQGAVIEALKVQGQAFSLQPQIAPQAALMIAGLPPHCAMEVFAAWSVDAHAVSDRHPDHPIDPLLTMSEQGFRAVSLKARRPLHGAGQDPFVVKLNQLLQPWQFIEDSARHGVMSDLGVFGFLEWAVRQPDLAREPARAVAYLQALSHQLDFFVAERRHAPGLDIWSAVEPLAMRTEIDPAVRCEARKLLFRLNPALARAHFGEPQSADLGHLGLMTRCLFDEQLPQGPQRQARAERILEVTLQALAVLPAWLRSENLDALPSALVGWVKETGHPGWPQSWHTACVRVLSDSKLYATPGSARFVAWLRINVHRLSADQKSEIAQTLSAHRESYGTHAFRHDAQMLLQCIREHPGEPRVLARDQRYELKLEQLLSLPPVNIGALRALPATILRQCREGALDPKDAVRLFLGWVNDPRVMHCARDAFQQGLIELASSLDMAVPESLQAEVPAALSER